MFCLASSWFKLWEQFVLGHSRDPPGPIDNRAIVVTRNGVQTLRTGSDYIQFSLEIWLLFHSIYGGGPEVKMLPNGAIHVSNQATCKPSVPALNTRLRARSVSESAHVQEKQNQMLIQTRAKAKASLSYSDPEEPDT